MSAAQAAPDILRITTVLADLSRLYPWFEQAAIKRGLPKPLMSKMQVVLEEAVMNVAMHAYAPGTQDEIVVRLDTNSGVAELVVEDRGPAFDPIAAPEKQAAKSLAEAKVGGLGIKMMRQFCPDMHYARLSGINQLTMRFAYGSTLT